MIANKKITSKLIWHIFGAILIALGVQIIIYSNIGSAPLDATSYYLAKLFAQIFLNRDYSNLFSLIGITALIFGSLVTLILLFIEKNKKRLFFTWLNILIVALFMFLWGFLFDYLIPNLSDDQIVLKIIIGLIGMIPLSIGIFITLVTGLPAGPHEELQKFYQSKVNNVFIARLIVELSYLIIAFLLMVISTKVVDQMSLEFTQIGWYTIVVSIGISSLVYLYNKIYIKIEQKFSKENDKNES